MARVETELVDVREHYEALDHEQRAKLKSDAERKALDAAAKARTMDTPTWARMELLQPAQRKA